MRHPKAVAWEKRLQEVFDRIDDQLEDRYGSEYQLHPARAKRNTTASRRHDGLFSVTGSFTPGFGSTRGRGYILQVRMVTLSKVPREMRTKIDAEVVRMLRQELPKAFPGRTLKVDRDGHVYKIHGDLSLGKV